MTLDEREILSDMFLDVMKSGGYRWLADTILASDMWRNRQSQNTEDTLMAPSEEIRTTSSTGGQKGVKPERYDLIPIEPLAQLARLYGFGANKYAAHNWRKGYGWSKSYASLMRHATQFWNGEDLDSESGLPHMASVVFHAFTLMQFMESFPEYDDRFKEPTPSVEIEDNEDEQITLPMRIVFETREDGEKYAEQTGIHNYKIGPNGEMSFKGVLLVPSSNEEGSGNWTLKE